jgi:hypothetical protein
MNFGFLKILDFMLKEIPKLRKVLKLKIPITYYPLATELMKEG